MSRRGNGEASVRLRGDGRWEARVRLPDGRRASLYAATRAGAVAAARQARADGELGVSAPDARTTFSDYFTRWLELARVDLKAGIYRMYESYTRNHILPQLGSVRLGKLTAYHIERMIAGLRADGLESAASTVFMLLRSSLKAAEKRGLIARSPMYFLTGVSAPRREYEVYDLEQSARYLLAASEQRLGALFTLALTTGMRHGELLALRWRDVELSREDGPDASASVVSSLTWVHGDPIFGTPKTKRSRRRIVLTALGAAALRSWRTRQREERLRAGQAWRTHLIGVSPEHAGERFDVEGLVFTDEIGRPYHQMTTLHAHRCVARAAGLSEIRMHDLRHTCATLLLAQGESPKLVSEMLGHSSVVITLDLYSHVLPDMHGRAVTALGESLSARIDALTRSDMPYPDPPPIRPQSGPDLT